MQANNSNTDIMLVRLEHEKRYTYEPAKRALDIVLASLALLVLSPVLLLVAAAIYLGDRGPVLFSQTRIGAKVDRWMKNGRGSVMARRRAASAWPPRTSVIWSSGRLP